MTLSSKQISCFSNNSAAIFLCENKRDEFNSSVLINNYLQYVKIVSESKYQAVGEKGTEFILTAFRKINKKNIQNKKNEILSNSYMKEFLPSLHYNEKICVYNLFYPVLCSDSRIAFSILSHTYNIKTKHRIKTVPLTMIDVSIHSLERFVQRANNNTMHNLISELCLLSKLNFFSKYSSKQINTSVFDFATKEGVWMGDYQNGIKTFVDEELLHSFDVSILTDYELKNINNAFHEYAIKIGTEFPVGLHDKDEKTKIILSIMTEIANKYNLVDYLNNWNSNKEKRLQNIIKYN
jgi:hypothetical protein